MPRLALLSWPVRSHEMVVGEDSEVCSKVTVPLTLESPLRGKSVSADAASGSMGSYLTVATSGGTC